MGGIIIIIINNKEQDNNSGNAGENAGRMLHGEKKKNVQSSCRKGRNVKLIGRKCIKAKQMLKGLTGRIVN